MATILSQNKKADFVQSRIDPKLKRKSIATLNKLGISMSEFINFSLAQMVRDKTVRFELSLLTNDNKKDYIAVKNTDHLKDLINL
jgi:addiction module RelB/DinJ family antitoxin